MPVSISSDITNNNYMQRLKLIQEAVSKVETSKIYDIPKINIIGEVDINKDNYNLQSNSTVSNGISIPMDVLESQKEQPKRVFSAMVLESNIRKIRLKKYVNEAEKLSKKIPTTKLNIVNESLTKVDTKNCEWNLLSKRSQRSAVIKYCNDFKFHKGELIKFDKRLLTELKSTLWEFIKSNPEYIIDYSEDEEIIVNIDFLKVSSHSFQLFNTDNEIVKEFKLTSEGEDNIPKKKKIKLKISNISDVNLKKDKD
jgi:hypothetical protein